MCVYIIFFKVFIAEGFQQWQLGLTLTRYQIFHGWRCSTGKAVGMAGALGLPPATHAETRCTHNNVFLSCEETLFRYQNSQQIENHNLLLP